MEVLMQREVNGNRFPFVKSREGTVAAAVL